MSEPVVFHRRRGGITRRIVGVLGELLVTVGLVVLLFVIHELWWTNIDADRQQEAATTQLTRQFARSNAGTGMDYGTAPEAKLPGKGSTFAILYVPRFGKDYARPITDGVDQHVLDNLGIGHYPQTQLPGVPGNFAVAAHRQTHGAVFWDIDKIETGDKIYVQTREGFYTYTYRSTEIVHPSETAVLFPVPHEPDSKPTHSLLTMTSCDPPFTTAMRIIVYAELTSWRPLEAGPPQPIEHVMETKPKPPR